MLNRDIKPNLLVNIIGSRMTLAPKVDKETGSVSYQREPIESFTFDAERSSADTVKKRLSVIRKFYHDQKPMEVRLMLTCQVIDFDPSKLPVWAKKLLPTWAQ